MSMVSLLRQSRPLWQGKLGGLRRSERFSSLQASDLAFFEKMLLPGSVLTDNLERYNRDWMGVLSGKSRCVLRPRTTQEISSILQFCNQRGLPVVPQGGNTGLVGGSVPMFDEIVLSLERMNRVVSVDGETGVAQFEAGVVLDNANALLQEKNLLFPLDLGAKGSCQVGGNLATNAGGLRLLRYGNLHGSTLGIEFVKADGTIVDVLSRNKKDNTGIDLKQLLIGSEGTLGVITQIVLQCPVLPRHKQLLLCCAGTYKDCVELFRCARGSLGEVISAFEFFDAEALRSVRENLNLDIPDFVGDSPFCVLIETSGSSAEHDAAKLAGFLESDFVMKKTLGGRGALAANERERLAFWAMRERIAESLLKDGYCYKYDVSVPNLSEIYPLVEKTRNRLATLGEDGKEVSTRVVGYGHMGDGNLHLNVTSTRYREKVVQSLEPWLWKELQRLGGSISAEHGIGSLKRDALQYSKGEEAISLMRRLKKIMDPKGILNPYKVIPPKKL